MSLKEKDGTLQEETIKIAAMDMMNNQIINLDLKYLSSETGIESYEQ